MNNTDKSFDKNLIPTLQDVVDDSKKVGWGLVTIGIDSLQEMIDEVKRLQAENGELQKGTWTSIEEELPTGEGHCLIFRPNSDPDQGSRQSIVLKEMVRIMKDATHWQEITEPEKVSD